MSSVASLIAQHLHLWGGGLGGVAAVGILIVMRSVQDHRVSLHSRVKPYLAAAQTSADAPTSARQVFQLSVLPISAALENLSSIFGFGGESVSQRLRLANLKLGPGEFRQLRVVAVIVALVIATVGSATVAVIYTLSWLRAVVLILLALFMALVLPDLYLSHLAQRRQLQISRQLPDFAELLALAVGSGQAVAVALNTVAEICGGPIAEEVEMLLIQTQTGTSLPDALMRLRQSTDSVPLQRLADSLCAALERGSPLAELLRDQALDTRHEFRQQMLVSGGKAEIAMLFPVVFGLLPLTVIFALFPALVTLQTQF